MMGLVYKEIIWFCHQSIQYQTCR